jgi:hypothetical protein
MHFSPKREPTVSAYNEVLGNLPGCFLGLVACSWARRPDTAVSLEGQYIPSSYPWQPVGRPYLSCKLLTPVAAAASWNEPRLIHVYHGQQIQGAINAAVPGDQILVEVRAYRAPFLIQKDHTSLIGHNAVLSPLLLSIV